MIVGIFARRNVGINVHPISRRKVSIDDRIFVGSISDRSATQISRPKDGTRARINAGIETGMFAGKNAGLFANIQTRS